jgi:two-component system, OmpR family, phosphate regulon response regulator OmpR
MTHEARHVLIVDDDRRIRELLAQYLSNHGYRVSSAANAADARKAMQGLAFDVIVLDNMMPGESGPAFAKAIRTQNNNVPILMLSALTDSGDRIQGLSHGSDDYLGKPFEPEELLLRLGNLLRRAEPAKPDLRKLRFGAYVFEIENGELQGRGERIHLTTREKDILRILAQRAGQAVPRTEFQTDGGSDGARAIDVQINRLRQKIEIDPANPVHLQTVRGQGYCLFAERD